MFLRPAAFALAAFIAVPALADVPRTPPPSPPTPSAGKAECAVRIIHALPNGDGTMDTQLASLAEDLKKPPFTAWKTFKLVDKSDATLTEGGSARFNTPSGRPGTLTYTSHGQRAGKHVIKLSLEVPGEKSNTRSHITLDEGGHFLVAGIKHQGGILIYAVSCKTEQ